MGCGHEHSRLPVAVYTSPAVAGHGALGNQHLTFRGIDSAFARTVVAAIEHRSHRHALGEEARVVGPSGSEDLFEIGVAYLFGT